MAAFGGFKLGQYRHWKKGHIYIAYDVTVDEPTQKESVSYVRLSDGSKHSRLIDIFLGEVDPNRKEENETGQRHAFKLMDTAITFVVNNKTATPSEPAVIEDGKLVKAEVLGEAFKTIEDYLKANGIPKVLPIKLGDTVGVWAPLVDDHHNIDTFTITGITNQGVYVASGNAHVFLPLHSIFSITLNFK
jgi:hypothetical protein